VSPGWLFLELKPAFNQFVKAFATTSKDTPAAATDWRSKGGPLTLAHMLHLAAGPDHATWLLQALLDTAAPGKSSKKGSTAATAAAGGPSGAGLFEQEVAMYGRLQATAAAAARAEGRSAAAAAAGDRGDITIKVSGSGFRVLTYTPNLGFRLMDMQQQPLLLAFSSQPLLAAGAPALAPVSIPWPSVQQLFSSFLWDEEHTTASVLLPVEMLGEGSQWRGSYITLCCLGDSGLVAVGESQVVSELAVQSLALGAAQGMSRGPWRGLVTGESPRLVTQLDWTLVKQAVDRVRGTGPAAPAAAAVVEASAAGLVELEGGWQTAVVEGEAGLVVDVLAPGPLSAGVQLQVQVVEGQVLLVQLGGATAPGSSETIKGGGSKVGSTALGASAEVAEGGCRVQLPPGVEWGTPCTKVSRPLGLLSVRLTPRTESS
jgi:hypothetical protein